MVGRVARACGFTPGAHLARVIDVTLDALLVTPPRLTRTDAETWNVEPAFPRGTS